ncbi:MAG: hypothetical protein ACW99G_22845, partial [Candidatus Thorarchaeota archaeon]|jgi:hypothetical protein
MNQREQLRERITKTIRFHIGGDEDMIEGIINDVLEAVADTIDDLEVPIDIEHYRKTKRHLTAETGRAIALWFRER